MLWELFIDKEVGRGQLVFVTDLYRRVIGTPTKLYNKHWDSFIAHVRDHHPRDILQVWRVPTYRKCLRASH